MDHNPVQTSKQLLDLSKKERLFEQLVAQVLKDFSRAGTVLHISKDMGGEEVKNAVQKKIGHLYSEQYDTYLSVMYIIDVSERELAQLPNEREGFVAEAVTFLILKREFQKVMLKARYN